MAKIHKCFRILFLQGLLIHPSYKKKKEEDFRINSTFRFDSPSLYGTSKGQQI
jgi:hypothetical protein